MSSQTVFTPIAGQQVPRLKKQQIITLDWGAGRKLTGRFLREEENQWWIRLNHQEPVARPTQRSIKINFALAQTLYFGLAGIVSFRPAEGLISLIPPEHYQSRPVRRNPRIGTDLDVAIILPGKTFSDSRFLYRSDNRLVNLSTGGAQLACRHPLPDNAQRILLLLTLTLDNSREKPAQIYCRGRIVRTIADAQHPAFPYHYGVQFDYAPPAFQRQLTDFITTLAVSQSGN